MASKPSVGLIVFGVINIIVGLLPPCAGCGGTVFFFTDPHLPIKRRDVGPEFKQHLDREVPTAKWEAIGAVVCNSFLCLMLIVGAVGLCLGQEWARWVSVGTAILLVLVFCVHDVYQFAVFRPSVMDFIDRNHPAGPEREGFKVGFTASFFLWSCFNPLVIIYLLAMSLFLALTGASSDKSDKGPRKPRRRRSYDDDDDDY